MPRSWSASASNNAPRTERFVKDEEANRMLSRTQRAPYGTDYVKAG